MNCFVAHFDSPRSLSNHYELPLAMKVPIGIKVADACPKMNFQRWVSTEVLNIADIGISCLDELHKDLQLLRLASLELTSWPVMSILCHLSAAGLE